MNNDNFAFAIVGLLFVNRPTHAIVHLITITKLKNQSLLLK